MDDQGEMNLMSRRAQDSQTDSCPGETVSLAGFYKSFLTEQECERVETCAYELRRICAEKPQHFELMLRGYVMNMRKMKSARKHPAEFKAMMEKFTTEIRRFKYFHNNIDELMKKPEGGTYSLSYWARWPDGIVYGIAKPDIIVTQLEFTWANLVDMPGQSRLGIFVEHKTLRTSTMKWTSTSDLADLLIHEPRIIIVSYGPAGKSLIKSVYEKSLMNYLGDAHTKCNGLIHQLSLNSSKSY